MTFETGLEEWAAQLEHRKEHLLSRLPDQIATEVWSAFNEDAHDVEDGHCFERSCDLVWRGTYNFAFEDFDAKFVRACIAEIEQNGGEMLLPHAPEFPLGQCHSLDLSVELGWIPVAVSWGSNGATMHRLSCRHARRGSRNEIEETIGDGLSGEETLPLWTVRFKGQRCGRCGGPLPLVNPTFVAFTVAAEQFAETGTIEMWQIEALLSLVADEAADRARKRQPSKSFFGKLADAVAEHGFDRFDAEAWVVGTGNGRYRVGGSREVVERAVARLRLLAAVIPDGRAVPDEPDLGDVAAVARWGRSLMRMSENEVSSDEVEALLFGAREIDYQVRPVWPADGAPSY